MKKLLIVCMLLLALGDYSAAGQIKAQPIDTLDEIGKVSAEAGYLFKSIDSNGTHSNGNTVDRDTHQNSLFWELNIGLMRGLQAEYRQRMSESGHESNWSDGWKTDQHYNGFSNPEFGLRADLIKMLSGESPVSVVLAYAYTPAKAGSTNQLGLDNWMYLQKGAYGFDTHTVDALLGWKTGKVNTYLGYRLEKNGTTDKRLFFDETFDPGDSHHLLFGSEATISNNVSIQADADHRMVNGMSGTGSFSDTTFGLTANYQAMKNVWLRPAVGFTRYGERTWCGAVCVSVDEAYGFNGGMSVKVLF